MQRDFIETLTGGLVIIIASFLLVYAYMGSKHEDVEGYNLVLKFDRADGLVEGSDVKMSGIKIGKVVKLNLDPVSFMAISHIKVDHSIKLPTDSSASIISESLLGGKYLNVTPGGDDQILKEGEEIQYTQSSMILENLIGQLIFGNKKKDSSKNNDSEEKSEAEKAA